MIKVSTNILSFVLFSPAFVSTPRIPRVSTMRRPDAIRVAPDLTFVRIPRIVSMGTTILTHAILVSHNITTECTYLDVR